jgi:signal transduction histidine kinase
MHEHILTQEQEYIEREHRLKNLLIKNIIGIATLAFILFGIMLGFYKIFNALLERDIGVFLDFFQKTIDKKQSLSSDDLFFKEFKTMAGFANQMVETISAQKSDLQELNASLEERVKAKTANLILINQNLEKEKTFSQELLQSQKEFLRYTVHETNTPLSVILTNIELYLMKNEKNRQLSKIEAAAKNIFSIYDDLSYLVKKDQIEYPKMAIDIDMYLKSRLDFFKEVGEQSKIHFDYTPSVSEVYIYFNETKLQRIIDNTITNAIKYTLADEIVDVTLKREGSFLDISMASRSKEIKDTEKIFDSFYREEKSRDGFGLGLRLVKNICNEENVKIFISSSNEKTSFTYRFKMMGE